ncbi:MAG: hypothetical protein HC837_18670 [Chloroflexaceae bacterium]|nr:hypothetical protein [Chloroflexaceae bacterium]
MMHTCLLWAGVAGMRIWRWVAGLGVVVLLLGGCVSEYQQVSSPVATPVAVDTGMSLSSRAASMMETGAGADSTMGMDGRFLSDPFLQLPTSDSVRVVWFTDFEGAEHTLRYMPREGEPVTVGATTTQMTRMYEDADSRLRDREYDRLTERDVWRHEAVATDLRAGVRVPYSVASVTHGGEERVSETFTLQPLPAPGSDMRILLTSISRIGRCQRRIFRRSKRPWAWSMLFFMRAIW